MKLEPLGQRVVVEVAKPEETTKGGIVIPDVAKERPNTATVLSVGPAVTCLQPGDSVLLPAYGGVEVKVSGKALRVLDINDIICRIK